jgi:predicted glycosyltransferase
MPGQRKGVIAARLLCYTGIRRSPHPAHPLRGHDSMAFGGEEDHWSAYSASSSEAPAASVRVLIYSHDTFGLGHLRRSRAIANALVSARPGVSVLIISGSPVIGSFEFGRGVDYVRIPGVTKQPDGDYRSLNLNVPIEEAVRLREALILQTAETFRPDIFIVDKEPTGFRGEVVPALDLLRARGCRIVLGVRDVLDEPRLLVPEWERKGALEMLSRAYDEIWVYGLPEVYRPLESLALPGHLARHTTYTGYLRREIPATSSLTYHPKITRQPFILVTTGGGGDGEDVIDWVISAYENSDRIELPALIVFGPFINRDHRRGFLDRIARHPKLDAISFDTKLEILMRKAAAVVAMGGYNTFCEILSIDRPSLIVPRTRPRREQLIRAIEAERLGLVRALVDDGSGRDPMLMAEALRSLPAQKKPSDVVIPGLLDGLEVIKGRFSAAIEATRGLQAAE